MQEIRSSNPPVVAGICDPNKYHAFYSLKIDKSPGYDDISYNAIKKCFVSLCESLKYLFNLLIDKDVFPDNLKIAQVTQIYKVPDSSDVSNFKPVSVPLCFSKIIDLIMYNHLHKYLIEYNIFILNNLISKTVIQLTML